MSVDDVNLYDPVTQSDWYPTYRQLRAEAPVYRMPGTNTYVISRYEDVLHVLRHQSTFPTGSTTHRTQAARDVYETKGWAKTTPLSSNPPDHRHYRNIVDGYFDPAGSLRWMGFIEATIGELLDGFASDGTADLVEAFALPLPVRVITNVLGFPAQDIPRLKAWSAAWVMPFSGGLSEAQEVWVAEQVVEFQHYIAGQIEDKRNHPGDDVLTGLTTASIASGRPLTTHEIITMIDHLFIGGNETTTFAITSAVWIMLREPGLYDLLREARTRRGVRRGVDAAREPDTGPVQGGGRGHGDQRRAATRCAGDRSCPLRGGKPRRAHVREPGHGGPRSTQHT